MEQNNKILNYVSTRSDSKPITSAEAIVKGLSEDGGLFVPTFIPKPLQSLESLIQLDYQSLAFEILSLFLPDFTEAELKLCIHSAYDSKFDDTKIAPLVKKGDAFYLELFHGSTIAFKDMALSILPYLMKTAAKKINLDKKIVILTATSGDTGKAALAGFADVDGTEIIVFYPKEGVSSIQKLQMVTQKGDNTHVVAIEGNFDDAQNGVKEMFNDSQLNKALDEQGIVLSSANSINIGRLVPQVVYYFYAYAQMVQSNEIQCGEVLNFSVPTGNFGNILAAYFAKQMGLPVGELLCASNSNNVLYDFFETGKYDRQRPFVLTVSPSMDILISSNLERLIYIAANRDAATNALYMNQLSQIGTYTITEAMKNNLSDFKGYYANEVETLEAIKDVFDETGYLMDTHTAVGHIAYMKAKDSLKGKCVIASTASPYKFPRDVMIGLDASNGSKEDLELLKDMESISKIKMPKAVTDILEAEILHYRTCQVADMQKEVKNILGLQ